MKHRRHVSTVHRRRTLPGLLAGAAVLALTLSGTTPALASGASEAVPEASAPVDCADLAGFEFESTVITAAETEPAGELANRGLPSASTVSSPAT